MFYYYYEGVSTYLTEITCNPFPKIWNINWQMIFKPGSATVWNYVCTIKSTGPIVSGFVVTMPHSIAWALDLSFLHTNKFEWTYIKPSSIIFRTPSQNKKYRSLGEHDPEGNCAPGNLKPQSLRNTNWRTGVASSGSNFPRMWSILQKLVLHAYPTLTWRQAFMSLNSF